MDQFDAGRASDEIAGAARALNARRRAIERARRATSARAFATACMGALGPEIDGLLADGASAAEIVSVMASAMPSVPRDDLQAALRAWIDGKRKRRSRTATENPDVRHAPKSGKQDKTTAPKPTASGRDRIPDLPPWADGSDQEPDESDEDYRLRKHIEGPPAARHKFIGESPAERADAILKSGKLDFGAGGPDEVDRKTLVALIERFGADAVERRIDAERKAIPSGVKLYPSTLRTRMLGGA